MKTRMIPKSALITRPPWQALAASLAALALATTASAGQKTWTGGGGDYNWGTAANWGGVVPANGDSLIFQGITRTTNANTLTGLILTGMQFNNSLFQLAGNSVTNSGGIYDNSGNNTNNLVTSLSASQGFTNAVSGTVLQLGGATTVLGTSSVLTFGGPGNIYLTGVWTGNAAFKFNGDGAGNGLVRLAGANTFTGPVTVNSGTLQLANAAAIPSGAGKGDVTNNATIDLNGNSQTIDGLFGTGVVDNKAGTVTYTLTVGNNATNTGGFFEFDGVLQNTTGLLALSKVNTNVFYLNGSAQAYGGNTTVSGGKLILGASATIGNSPVITVAQGAQLDVSQQTSLSLGANEALYAGRNTNGGPGDILGSVDNSGKIVILGPNLPGTLRITNNLTLESGSTISFDLAKTNTLGGGVNDLVTMNGTLTLNGGTIQLNPYNGSLATGANGTYTLITNSQALETGTAANLTIAAPRGVVASLNDTQYPGSLLVSVTGGGSPVALVWNGSSGANWDVQSTQDWLSNNVPDYFYYLDNVVFNDVGNGNVNLATGVSPSSTVFANSATNAYNLTGAGAIAGSGTLSIVNGGSAFLNTANLYTGDTIVSYGQLLLGNPSSGNNVVYTGVTPGNLVLGNGGVYQVGAANISGVYNFNSIVLNPGGGSITMRNRQSSSTPYFQITGSINRNVGGTLALPSLATRATSKSGLYFTSPNLTNGIFGGYATIYLNDWLAIQVNPQGNFATNYNLYQVSATPSAWGANSNVNLTASTTANINTASINTLKISAAATATINAGQTLTLNAGGILIPNNGTGSGVITGGTIEGATNADLVVINNAVGNTLTIASTIADNGGPTALTKSGQGNLVISGNNTYSGATYINGAEIASGNQSAAPLAFYNPGTLIVGAGGTSGNLGNSTAVTNYGTLAFNRQDNISLNIPVNGPGGLRQQGTGALTLTANNSYTGPTVISSGTLQVGAGSAAGSLGTASSITNNGTLVFDRPDAVVINGPVSGSGALINLGTGSLTLNNTNSYHGLTTISNGTVLFGSAASAPLTAGFSLSSSGSTLDVSAISGGLILSGGTIAQSLTGIGTVNGSVTATNNNSLIPGTIGTTGTLTINNNLTVSGATLNFDVGNSAKDLLNVGGALTLNSGGIVLNTLGTLNNGTYKLIGYGSLNGVVANLSFSGFSQSGQLAYLTNNTSGNEIDLVVYSGTGANLTWVGDGANNFWDITTSPDWSNGTGASVFHNNDNVTFNDSSANPTVVLYTNVAPGSLTITTTANNYNFNVNSSGNGAVVGGGKITINANSTTVTVLAPLNNSGATVINSGTVQVGNGSVAGSLGIGAVTNNAVLNFDEPANSVFSGSLAGTGSFFQQGSSTLYLEGNNDAYMGPVTISSGTLDIGGGTANGTLGSSPVTNNGTLLVERNGSLTLNNNITGSGPVAFLGGGTTLFGGNNTYANNTYISNGIVKLGSSSAIYSDGGAGDWLILDGNANGAAGTLDLNGHNLSVNALAGLSAAQNGLIDNAGGTGTNTLAIVGAATTTYSGTLQDNTGTGGKLALLVEGAANQTIDVQSVLGNTFTGGTVISNATVHLTASAALGTPVNLGTGPVTLLNGTLYAVGGFAQSTGPTWTSLANNVIVPTNYSGTIYGPARGTLSANVTGGGSLTYITTYVRGQINGNWSGFNGQITFGGTTAGGQLGIGATYGFGHLFLTNSGSGVTLYNTVAGTPTINIGELADDGSAYIEATSSGNAGGVAANFAVGGLNTSTNYGGGIIDAVGIIKVGTGSWTLTSANVTYSGLTTVSNGVLVLGASATLPNSNPITLASPGILDVSAAGSFSLGAHTLQGNGTLNGSLVTASGSIIQPGWLNSIGILTVTNDLNLQGTAVLELNRTNTPLPNDRLVAHTIEAGGTLQVNNLGPDLHTGDRFQLFSTNVTGAFTVTNLPVTTGNGSITYVWQNNLAVDGSLTVLVGVPNVNTTPTNITASVSGGVLTLTWPADHTGWHLQAQTNSLAVGLNPNTNAWTTVPDSSSVNTINLPINPALPTVFYRLVYP